MSGGGQQRLRVPLLTLKIRAMEIPSADRELLGMRTNLIAGHQASVSVERGVLNGLCSNGRCQLLKSLNRAASHGVGRSRIGKFCRFVAVQPSIDERHKGALARAAGRK